MRRPLPSPASTLNYGPRYDVTSGANAREPPPDPNDGGCAGTRDCHSWPFKWTFCFPSYGSIYTVFFFFFFVFFLFVFVFLVWDFFILLAGDPWKPVNRMERVRYWGPVFVGHPLVVGYGHDRQETR